MTEQEVMQLWKTQDIKLEQSLAINRYLLREAINTKAHDSVSKLIRIKTRGIVSLVIYLLVLGFLLVMAITHYMSAFNYFIASTSVIVLINFKALYDYIRHLTWAKQINYADNVTEIQAQLSRIQLSIFQHSRIMALQFPFFTTIYLTDIWFPHNVGWGYMVFQAALTGSFIYLSYWLYKHQTIENADKKWLQILLTGSGGKAVQEAQDFYKEIEEFKLE